MPPQKTLTYLLVNCNALKLHGFFSTAKLLLPIICEIRYDLTGSGVSYKVSPLRFNFRERSLVTVCMLACLSIESECEKPKVITNCAHLVFKGRETVLTSNRAFFTSSFYTDVPYNVFYLDEKANRPKN